MQFHQKLLSKLITCHNILPDTPLRPDEIQRISKSSIPNLITVSLDKKQLQKYQLPKTNKNISALRQERKKQYDLVCILIENISEETKVQKTIALQGLEPSLLYKLKSLSYSQIIEMINSTDEDFILVKVDQKLLEMAVMSCVKQNKLKSIIESLIKAGATKKFMFDEYAVTPNKYRFYRKAFDLDEAYGRPRMLTEEESYKVYDIWKQNQHMRTGERYLQIHRKINAGSKKTINIRNIATAIVEIQEIRA